MSTFANVTTSLAARSGGDEAGAAPPQSKSEAGDEDLPSDFAGALAAFTATLVPPPPAPAAAPVVSAPAASAPAATDPGSTSTAPAVARRTAAGDTAHLPLAVIPTSGSADRPSQASALAPAPAPDAGLPLGRKTAHTRAALELSSPAALPEGSAKAAAARVSIEPGADHPPHNPDTLATQLAAQLPQPGTRFARLSGSVDPIEPQPPRPPLVNLQAAPAESPAAPPASETASQAPALARVISMPDEASLQTAARAIRETRLFEIRQAQLRGDRAELLIGSGENSIRLLVHARAARVRVTATVPSPEAALHLKDNLHQLGQALTRHGLMLDGFSIESPPPAPGARTGDRDASSGHPDDPQPPPNRPGSTRGAAPEPARTPAPVTGLRAIA